MAKENANTPMWHSAYAQLVAVNITPRERKRAKLYLQRAEELVDLLFASAAGLKRLFDVAILKPVQYLRRRRGARWPQGPAGELE